MSDLIINIVIALLVVGVAFVALAIAYSSRHVADDRRRVLRTFAYRPDSYSVWVNRVFSGRVIETVSGGKFVRVRWDDPVVNRKFGDWYSRDQLTFL